MTTIRSAVVGVGYLGKFHADKFAALPNSNLIGVCDSDKSRCDEVASLLNTTAFYDYHELVGKVDAVSIAVPTALHYKIAKTFLEAGVHVLLEKPITDNLADAEELIELAKKHQVVFQIGHLERFNSVLVALDNVIDNPRFIESTRLAPFKPRGTDINVVLDLMIHDIDIIQRIVNSPVAEIRANGAPVLSNMIDIANARIQFENGCVANVTASRVSFKTERKLRMFQHDAYIVMDMHNKKLSIHRKGVSELFPGVPDITSEEQAFEQGDALMEEIKSFLQAIESKSIPAVTGEDGKNALATAIQITQIVRSQMESYFTANQQQAETVDAE